MKKLYAIYLVAGLLLASCDVVPPADTTPTSSDETTAPTSSDETTAPTSSDDTTTVPVLPPVVTTTDTTTVPVLPPVVTTTDTTTVNDCADFPSIQTQWDTTSATPWNSETEGSNNSRFCIHTVADGNHRLLDGALTNSSLPKGLQIAFADLSVLADFYTSLSVCASLTINGTQAGDWMPPMSEDAQADPRARGAIPSAESISAYLKNQNLATSQTTTFWTSSQYKGISNGVINADLSAFFNVATGGKAAYTTCIAQMAIVCVKTSPAN